MIEPSGWVDRHLPVAGTGCDRHRWLIDWACGQGRNSRLALERGWRVLAIDRDQAAIESLVRLHSSKGPPFDREALHTICMDLESDDSVTHLKQAMAERGVKGVGAILVCNYLFRLGWQPMLGLLEPGACLIYETFAQGQEHFGRPRRGAFLLQAGELLAKAQQSQLAILAYEDLVQSHESGKPSARLQRIYARK